MPPTEEQLEDTGGDSSKYCAPKAHCVYTSTFFTIRCQLLLAHCTPDMEEPPRDSGESSAGSSAVMFSLIIAIASTMNMFQSD